MTDTKEDFPHELILAQGSRRFPLESYRQLVSAGSSRAEALEMLGFREEELPSDPGFQALLVCEG